MTTPSKSFTDITDGRIDAESPVIEDLTTDLRDNVKHVQELVADPADGFTPEKNHNHDGVNSKGVAPSPAVSLEMNDLFHDMRDSALTPWDSSNSVGGAPSPLIGMDLIYSSLGIGGILDLRGQPFPMFGAWRFRCVIGIESWANSTFDVGLREVGGTANTYAYFSKGTNSGTVKARSKRQSGDAEVSADNLSGFTFGTTYGDLHELRIDWTAIQALDPKGRNERSMQFLIDGTEVAEFNFDNGGDLFAGLSALARVTPFINVVRSGSNVKAWVESCSLVRRHDARIDFVAATPLPTT